MLDVRQNGVVDRPDAGGADLLAVEVLHRLVLLLADDGSVALGHRHDDAQVAAARHELHERHDGRHDGIEVVDIEKRRRTIGVCLAVDLDAFLLVVAVKLGHPHRGVIHFRAVLVRQANGREGLGGGRADGMPGQCRRQQGGSSDRFQGFASRLHRFLLGRVGCLGRVALAR